MTQIICLANSWKNKERCIAGINPDTSKWIRPVSKLDDGRVPSSSRLIDGQEPILLDILEIPLSDTGPNFDFESENLLILPGEWRRVGRVRPEDILRYCEHEQYILHNKGKAVTLSFIQGLPMHRRRTLQLVRTREFVLQSEKDDKGNLKWRGSLVATNGAELVNARITDPIFVKKLNNKYLPGNDCLVTVSLGMPQQQRNAEEKFCSKLIAGVIELDNLKDG